MGIFGGYDVRGIYGKDLAEKEMRGLGSAFATFLGGGTIALGRDNRLSSDSLRDAFVEGAMASGSGVIDVGIVPTPVLYFAIAHLKTKGGAVITASHNPPDYNGVKMCRGTMPLETEELKAVEKIFLGGKFASGSGKAETAGIAENYVSHVLRLVPKVRTRLKVVVDAGNGVCGLPAAQILRGLGCKVVCLYCEPDGRFPNHLADPTKEENVRELKERVIQERADLGIAFDGDGDRCLFVDETGSAVRADDENILFARSVLEHSKGAKIIFELRNSLAFPEEVKRCGGVPIMVKAGRVAVRHELARAHAAFGCETTGHVCFAENSGFDDGIFAGAKMAALLSQSGKRMSELCATVPHYFATRELRLHVPNERKFGLVEELREELERDYPVNTLDGVRVEFPDSWGLARVSQTEPVLSLRFEGKSRKALEKVFEIVRSKLSGKGVELPPLGEITL